MKHVFFVYIATSLLLALSSSPVGTLPPPTKPSNPESDFLVLSPREAYYKLLISQFSSYLDHSRKIQTEDFIPSDPNFKKFDYQIQAVNQAFSILEKHHGVMIADVVGLGKTFSALMIVKRWLIHGDSIYPENML